MDTYSGIVEQDRVNEGFKKLQAFNIYDKYLVYGYLRKQQTKWFELKQYQNCGYFNLHSVAVVILMYSGEVECIYGFTDGITKCNQLVRCLNTMKKYNEWLDKNNLTNRRKLRSLVDYDTYLNDVNTVISYNESLTFSNDAKHIKHTHHYNLTEIREYISNNTQKKHRKCVINNCFNFKYFYLCNKNEDSNDNKGIDLLDSLTNLHLFLFHSRYISSLAIENVHPRVAYFVICYFERQLRQLNININTYSNKNEITNDIEIRIIHLISFYYAGKVIDQTMDYSDCTSPLGLVQFVELTMNKVTLNMVWSKLDRDGLDTIDIDELDDILLLIAILSIATAHKERGGSKPPQIDKTEVKNLMKPIGEWIKRDKMNKQPVIIKEEFMDTFSKWLKEYHKTNGGIIADDHMQERLLKKYAINNNDAKNITEKTVNLFKSTKTICISDRLVISNLAV